jgi:hypothetical protein
MASLSKIPRDEKRRIASEIHDNLSDRATSGPADGILDPFITKSAAIRDALAEHVGDKSAAMAERTALLAECDVNDDEVDRWYRHVFRYLEVEALRRHAPEHASIDALLSAAYPEGLEHVDARIPDQNEEVRKSIEALRNPEYAATLTAILFPPTWLDVLEIATKKSDGSFAAYQASIGEASTAVTMGRDAEGEWVTWARALGHAVALRSSGASGDIVEEGKRLLDPLNQAIRRLRSQARARATKRDQSETP